MKITIDIPAEMAEFIDSNVGDPFGAKDWPRGKTQEAKNKRAEYILKKGVEKLRNWDNNRQLFRVAAFDGGGFRGLYSAIVAQRLYSIWGNWTQNIDMYVGTSTGAIMACALACDISIDKIVSLYRDKGSLVFADSMIDDIKDLGVLIGADYSSNNLKKELEILFGDKKLKDIPKKTLIVTFDLDAEDKKYGGRCWKSKIYYSDDKDDGEVSIVEALLQSTAAPIYFPSHSGFVDGGVAANNPSVVAIAAALKQKIEMKNIKLVSIGTGKNQQYVEGDNHDWGIIQWAKILANMVIDAGEDVSDYQAFQILDGNYLRLNSKLHTKVSLGDVNKAQELEDAANSVDIDSINKGFWQ